MVMTEPDQAQCIYGKKTQTYIVLPAKCDSLVMFCLQHYQPKIDRSLVY